MINLAGFERLTEVSKKASPAHAQLSSALLPTTDSTVCILDDDPDSVRPLSKILIRHFSQLGGSIEARQQTNESTEELAEWVLGCKALVLVTDNNMRDTLGVDVIAKIQELAPERAQKMTFIIMSGLPGEAEKIVAERNSGSNNHMPNKLTILRKPVQVEKIVSIVERAFVESAA